MATILALTGELGSGKTELTRSLLRVLGVKGRVTSPTFTLIRKYKLSARTPFKLAFHIDCYRLKKPEELLMLGFREIIENPEHLVIIEWPELMKKYIPSRSTVKISLSHGSPRSRFGEAGKKQNERIIRF
ncbi:MAG: tRNA (adenosine(37)-N6)-threonylcarbamoyltransferase complex ATPase subunit type 1 TsaE [Patescibacteria group bacterium]